MTAAYVLLAVLLSLGAGVALRRRLGGRGYRYDDERDTRVLSLWWLPPVAAVVLPLVAVGGWRLGGWLLAVVQTGVAITLLALAAIDLDVHRLPDRITKPLALATAIGLAAVVAITGDLDSGVRAVLAALVLGGFYLVLAFIGGGSGMGLGDVKLSITLGLLLGFHSWSHVVVATTVAFVTGTLWGVGLIVARRGGLRSAFAFGPHMVAAALVVLALPGVGPILDQF